MNLRVSNAGKLQIYNVIVQAMKWERGMGRETEGLEGSC